MLALIFVFALSMNEPSALLAMGVYSIAIVVLFGCVLLHELGHSVVAQHYGIRVSHITLWPFGGVAWMEEIPEDPKMECAIAIAGPAVNLALAAAAAPLLLLPSFAALASAFISMNLMLGLFNLVPAFPMDGGRVLRSLLAFKVDWLRATEQAVRIGKYTAIIGGIWALLNGFIFAPVIAVYILVMGQRELFALRARKMGTGFPFSSFAEAAQRAREQYANRQSAGGPFGFESASGFQTPGDYPSEDDFPSEDRREAPRRVKGGFSEEDIEKLESFRGRMRRNWRESE